MRRWIPIALLLAAAAVSAGALILYLAYGIGDDAPRRSYVEDLEGTVQVAWHGDEFATIRAESELDRMVALGYAHGVRRAWSVSLWRQAASGRLGEWFGPEVAELDRLARQLGFARLAMLAVRDLNEEDRAVLEAYTRGINAGLSSAGSNAGEFAALEVSPYPWEPWHTLAIERLFSWLATSVAPPESGSSDDLRDFFRRDLSFRTFLQVGGFAHSAAWTVRDSSDVLLVQRHVTGASALPLFLEVRFARGDTTLFTGASIPGTPFFPAGRTDARAWSLLLSSDARISAAPVDPARVDTVYDRLEMEQSDELLMRTPILGDRLVLGSVAVPIETAARPAGGEPDQADTLLSAPATVPATDSLGVLSAPRAPASVWVLAWAGLRPESDFSAWMALSRGESPAFRLIHGNGLSMSRQGEASILGNPVVQRAYSRGVFVSNVSTASYVAARLDSIAADVSADAPAPPYLDDCRSTWASALEPQLVAYVETSFSHVRFVEEALTYLLNWDFSYDRTSIAASIFDTWMSAYRDSTGAMPSPGAIDDSLAARHQLYASLIDALNHLVSTYGTDMSQWRWEVVAPHSFYFPVWSTEDLPSVARSVLHRTRYAPIEVAGEGHPTTLCWGPSPVVDSPSYPGHWESWISTGMWERMYVLRTRLDRNAFLARYRISDRPPAAVIVGPESPVSSTTRLLPLQ